VEKIAKTELFARRPHGMPGIDVLSKQGDLAHAGRRKLLCLVDDLGQGTGDLRATGVGHHAEGAELVATFLHRQKGSDVARAACDLGRVRQMFELVLDRVVGVDNAFTAARAAKRVRQSMIGLRTDDDIDCRHPPGNLLTLGLGHTTGNPDHELPALGFARLLHIAQAAEGRIDLFGRLLADMAGVEENEIRLLHVLGGDIAFHGQRIGHATGIIDIHLAAIGLDEDLAARCVVRFRKFRSVQCCYVLAHAGYVVFFRP